MIETINSKYNLSNPKIKKLVGYDIVNYKIESDSENYILKVYPDKKEEIDLAEAENEILIHLQKQQNSQFPEPIKNSNNNLLTPFRENNTKKNCPFINFFRWKFLG